MDDEFTPDEESGKEEPENEATEGKDKETKEEKSISSDLIRGHINTIILRALYDGDKYGYAIIAEIERKSHGQYSMKQPSLYSALKRLEKDGYISSYWGGSVGGGRRKYFSLTELGKEIAEQNLTEWEYSRTVIDSLISDRVFDFSNPAPTAVDMRVLRSSTSRVTARGEDDEELDYEPSFDDSAERERIEAEYEDRATEMAKERQAFEEEKQRFEEEMRARSAAYLTERGWREHELAERERALDEREKQLEATHSEHLLYLQQQEAEDAASAAEEAEFDERVRLFEEEEASRKQAIEQEENERRRILDEEETSRKEALADEEASRREAMDAEESERRRLLDEELEERRKAAEEEENDRKRAYEAEEAERRRALEDEEAERRRILDDEEAERRRILDEELEERRRDFEDSYENRRQEAEAESRENIRRTKEIEETLQARDEQIRTMEQTLQERERQLREQEDGLRTQEQQLRQTEAYYRNETVRLTDVIRQREEQIVSERAEHAAELNAQREAIIKEQQAVFDERQQQLIHQNYLDLVSGPAQPQPQAPDGFSHYTPPAPDTGDPSSSPSVQSDEDYRKIISGIYEGTADSRPSEPAAETQAQELSGIHFDDIQTQAAHDGIRITTAGGKTAQKANEESFSIVHKGKALFLSAIVVFCICVVEGAVAFGMQAQYGLPTFYPYFIWCAGVALLLVTGLAYANRYGERSIRRKAPILINAVVAYTLTVIVTLIVALGVNIDFTDPSALATYVIVPVIFFFGIVVFGLCYYLLTRPKKD